MIFLWITGILAATGLAFVLDYRKYSSRFRTGLILLSGILLIGFVTEPEWWSGDESRIILLTDGARPADLPRSSQADFYSVESQDQDLMDGATWLSSVSMLSEKTEAGSVIEIYGMGTDEFLPEGLRWVNKLRSPGNGILLDNAPHQVDAGKNFEISGMIKSSDPPDSVMLFRDGSQVDIQKPDEDGQFSFQDVLWSDGPARYQIETTVADSLLSEPWNIRATEPEPLSVAVLLYSPSFEISHLAEWLGTSGHQLAIRTRVGQERFRFDDINDPPQNAEEFIDDLSGFDLLVLDPREFAELNSREIQRVKESVENGLDLMLLPPSENQQDEWEQLIEEIAGLQIPLNPIDRVEERQWTPGVVEGEELGTLRLPILDLNYSDLNEQVQVLYTFDGGSPVAIRLPVLQGSVSAHLFYGSYRWKLRGDQENYNRFWSDYLDKIITLETHYLELGSTVPKVNRRLLLATSGENLTVRDVAQNRARVIPVVAGAEHPGVSYGYDWPKTSGWHRTEAGETDRWFFVYHGSWTFSENYRRYEQTEREIQAASENTSDDIRKEPVKVPDWIWLVGFLVLQMILWVERKVG